MKYKMIVTTTAICDSLRDLDHMIGHITGRKIGYNYIPKEGLLIESGHSPSVNADGNAKEYNAQTTLQVEPVEETEADKKIGRNDPCWCGSGDKFKRCHGRK